MKRIKMMFIAMVAIFIVAGNSAYASFPVKSEKKQIETTQVAPATTNPDETPVTVVNKEKSAKPDEANKANKTHGDGSTSALVGFIASIVGLVGLRLGIFSLALLITGVVLSAIGLKSDKRGLAIAGLIIGIIGLAIWLLAIIFIATLIGASV